ncbi:hypothetical protein [Blastococcus goldschmidtiae]|uniref:Uncharacterized protein n=1 Tax=Blastococcus goldschmidtiae TaxID=3075546 RepID=A0ABU2K708_9ACTN|nr:hypothetical protein [Blastococcus sp. DSM 46792]MDT0275979.1 hypothetical protein [Blastococcus sp. DSM 46792]
MREPGPPELLVEHRIQLPRVPHHEARQQPGRTRLEHPVGRAGQAVPQFSGDPLPRVGDAEGGRRTACREHRHDVVPGPGRRDHRLDPGRLAGQELPPPLFRGEEQDGRLEVLDPLSVAEDGDRRVGDDPGPAAAGEEVRIAVEVQVHRDGPVVVGQRAER